MKLGLKRWGLIPEIQLPNKILQVGVFESLTGNLPLPKFIAPIKHPIQQNMLVDSRYASETGKGKIYIPKSADGYLGEVL